MQPKYCTFCGGNLKAMKYNRMTFDRYTGEKQIGYQLICENNKATSEGSAHDFHELSKGEFDKFRQ